MTLNSQLKVRDLSLRVHLGCSLGEQEHAQEVRVSFDVKFARPPGACQSDRLDDTVCYAKLSEAFRKFSGEKPFWTVEKLAQGYFEILRELVPRAEALRLSLHKVKPPVDGLLGGVVFEIEDGKWR